MAYRRVNGIGTWPCKAGYDVGWGADDAVVCFTLFYLPLIPLYPVHVWAEKEAFVMTRAAIMPIRQSGDLVVQAMLHGWSRVFLFFTIVFGPLGLLFLAAPSPKGNSDFHVQFFWFISVPVFILWLLGSSWSRHRADRPRKIRLLLGPHALGTSDPATWLDETVSRVVSSPKEMSEAESFSQASESFLSRQDFHRAMWSARFSTACEDRQHGEWLTDRILDHPGASEALKTARPKIRFWQRPL
jgi:hypothetical protein